MDQNEDDGEIELELRNEEVTRRKPPLFFQSLKTFVQMMFKIRWRKTEYKFIYFSSLLICLSASSLFISVELNTDSNPRDVFLSKGPRYYISDNPYLHFSPNTSDVYMLKNFNGSISGYGGILFDDLKSMKNFIETNESQFFGIGFHLENGFKNQTIVVNRALIDEMPLPFYDVLMAAMQQKINPPEKRQNFHFKVSAREYAKLPQVVGVENVAAAYYLVFPFFEIMILSMDSHVKMSLERNYFSLLINGLPELALYIGNFLIYFCESIPLSFAISYFITDFSQYVDFSLLFLMMTLFVVSFNLRFVTYSTFFKSENVLSFFANVYQIVDMIELNTLVYIPNMSNFLLFILLIFIPEYPLYYMYYVYLRQSKKEIKWSTLKIDGLFSYIEIIQIQILNIIMNLIFASFFIIMNSKKYGQPLIGWRNMFKKQYWKRLFRISSSVNILNEFNYSRNRIIELNNVKYTYKSKRKGEEDITALNSIDFTISKGEVIVLVGPNGSGKSTLIDILIGAMHQDEGEVKICGNELLDVYYEYHEELGVVFQNNPLFDQLTVREHFYFFAFRYPKNNEINNNNGNNNNRELSEIDTEMNRLCEMLRITNILDSFTKDISGGEKRKLCLALALLQKPRFLIVDEPTSGVDAFCREHIWRVVGSFSNEITTIVSTHSLEESESILSRIAVLQKGKILFAGTGAEMRLQFNSGYKLSFVNEEVDIIALQELVKEVIPEVKVSAEKKNTLILPSDLRVSDALELIERRKSDFNVEKYSIQIDTLEESLIKLIEEEEGDIHLDISL